MDHRQVIAVPLVLMVACIFMVVACTSCLSSFQSGLNRWALLKAGTRYEIDVTIYCLKVPDDCLMLIPDAGIMKEQFLVPLEPDQARALIDNRETFGIGYWPSSDRTIASEQVAVAGSWSTIDRGVGPATAWNVHVTVRTENVSTLALVAAVDIAVIAGVGAAVFLAGTVAAKVVKRRTMKSMSGEGGV